jgi:hypothetical protein
MLTDKERKLGLFIQTQIQTQQLIKALDKLRQQGYEELQFRTETCRWEFIGRFGLITNFNSEEK